MAKSPGQILMMLSLKDCTSPLSSHGSCKLIDEYPYCTEGPCNWGDEAGILADNRATCLVVSCWLTP